MTKKLIYPRPIETKDIKTLGNYSEKEKMKYELKKTRNF